MKKVAIIDYGSGNLHSAVKAFEAVANETKHSIILTSDPEVVKGASHIVLPGVGAFADCKAGLGAIDGMMDALTECVINSGKPFLGICVGMQLLADIGHERGEHSGFGWIKGSVEKIKVANSPLKIPHMGWNDLIVNDVDHALFKGINDGDHAYFVHSYHFVCEKDENKLAQTGYGGVVTAAIGRDNIMGVQFHPEKSQNTGMKIINNFLSM